MVTRAFIHGIGCRVWQWGTLTDGFDGSNHYISLPGHPDGSAESGLDGVVTETVEKLVEMGGVDLLIGHSMGGIVGLLASIRVPGLVNALVILDSSLHTSTSALLSRSSTLACLERETWYDVIRGDLLRSLGTRVDSATAYNVANDLDATDRASIRRLMHDALSVDTRQTWQMSSVPTLYVESERGVDASQIRRFKPDAHHVSIAAGHWPHLEDPHSVANALRTFEAHALRDRHR